MKKHTANYHLSRDYSARQALFKSLVRSLILREKIETTAVKAAAVTPIFEKLLTKAKVGTVAKIRQIHAFLGDNTLVRKLVHDIAPRYQEVHGGYTKVVRYGNRRGDNAVMVRWSLTKARATEANPKAAAPTVEPKAEKTKKAATPKAIAPARKTTVKKSSVMRAPSRAGKRGDK